MNFIFDRPKSNALSKESVLKALEEVAKKFDYTKFSSREFANNSEMAASTVKRKFGSWTNGIEALKELLEKKKIDLKERAEPYNQIYSTKQLFDEMERIWKKVGHRPSRTEWELEKAKISMNAYKRRFKGWSNACLKFIEYKMGNSSTVLDSNLPKNDPVNKKSQLKTGPSSELSRNIPLGIRLKVLNKDKFKCVFCGKSPATHLGTVLHIDHIRPFSKGGKTVIENLQTLCFDCNIGKSNLDINSDFEKEEKKEVSRGGNGGQVFIISERISGNGLISVDGGNGEVGGNAGKVNIESKINNYSGKISARGGKATRKS